MIVNRQRLRVFVNRHRFTAVIALVIAISILMTVVSISLYVSSGTLQLDLSRPGYESVRKEITPVTQQDFSATGPVDTSALEDFQKQFNTRRTQLNSISRFNDTTLDDESLGVMSTVTQNQ